jgi:hypothetical protein
MTKAYSFFLQAQVKVDGLINLLSSSRKRPGQLILRQRGERLHQLFSPVHDLLIVHSFDFD